MEAFMNPEASKRQCASAGFSMIELLMTAFILAVGLLGLTMLQAMSMRSSTGSRALANAVMVGEGVLESIQSEGRQRLLSLRYTRAAPTTTTYFVTTKITQYYAFDGTKLPNNANAFYTVEIEPADVVATGLAGGTRQFTLIIHFVDSVGSSGTPHERQVTLTRQVGYA